MRRVAVVGASGSGKSTFARALSARLGVPHVELDAIHWQPNWTTLQNAEFRARVAKSIQQAGWVVDGNYAKTRDLVWSAADTVIWLDYSLALVMWRLVRRTIIRSITAEVLWGTNQENFWRQFVPPNGLFPWLLSTHPKYRRETPAALRSPEYRHLKVVRLATPRDANSWLGAIKSHPPTPFP